MSDLRSKVAKLAKKNPELRVHLVPLLKNAECEDPGNKTRSKGEGKGKAKGDGEGPVGEPKKSSMAKQAGYTQYWRFSKEEFFDDRQWSKLLQITKQIIGKAKRDGIQIAGPMGTGKPVLTNNEISLNGVKPEYHESFSLDRTDTSPGFCKTAKKPYDAVVVSILAAAKKIAPKAIKVSSDGGSGAIKRFY